MLARGLFVAVWLVLVAAASGQSAARSGAPAAGQFLIASRGSADPNFAQTVILLTRHTPEGTMGLIVNRQTRFRLSQVFAGSDRAKERSDIAFSGGPVGRTGAVALLRSPTRPAEAEAIFADIYLIASKSELERTMIARVQADRFRVYLGYAGWAPQQLENEIESGAWIVRQARPGLVFDSDPDTLWTRLMQQSELRLARR